MPISKYAKSLVNHLNSKIAIYTSDVQQPLKLSHSYDLLACLCGLDKYHFQRVGFVSSSLFMKVPTYKPKDREFLQVLEEELGQLLCQKAGLNKNDHYFLIDWLVGILTENGFNHNGECIRHPDQLILMLRELYCSENSILEHLDSVIELIDNLEYVVHTKKKELTPAQYWVLHWCYAVLIQHDESIKKELVKGNKVKAKQKALMEVYQSYFERSQASLEKYYEKCLEVKFDQAVIFDKQMNRFLGTDFYSKTHSFATVNRSQEFDYMEFSLPYKEFSKNLFPTSGDLIFNRNQRDNSFESVLPHVSLDVETVEQDIVLILIHRLFQRDVIGTESFGEDFVMINNYQYLFSDNFEIELKQRYPLLNERGSWNRLERTALSIFSHMYRYYLKQHTFEGYEFPSLTELVEN